MYLQLGKAAEFVPCTWLLSVLHVAFFKLIPMSEYVQWSFYKTKEKRNIVSPCLQNNQIPSKLFDIWASSLNNCRLDSNENYKPIHFILIKKIWHVNVNNVTARYFSSNAECCQQLTTSERRTGKETFWDQASSSVIQLFGLPHKPLVVTTVGDRATKMYMFDWRIPVSMAFIYCVCPS